jgi:hypothetical protein
VTQSKAYQEVLREGKLLKGGVLLGCKLSCRGLVEQLKAPGFDLALLLSLFVFLLGCKGVPAWTVGIFQWRKAEAYWTTNAGIDVIVIRCI